jgi:hypothetical protein
VLFRSHEQNTLRSAPKLNALLQKNRTSGFQSAAFFVVMGVLLLVGGVLEGLQAGAIFGGLLAIYGIVTAVRTLRSPRFEEGNPIP